MECRGGEAGEDGATRNVDAIADGDRAHAVARHRHRVDLDPRVLGRVVDLDLRKDPGRIRRIDLTAQDDDAAVERGGGVAAARGVHRRQRCPLIRFRLVASQLGRVVLAAAVAAPADDVESTTGDDGSEMVAPGVGEVGERRPFVPHRIVGGV